MATFATEEYIIRPVMPTAIFSVYCFIQVLDTIKQPTNSYYLVGHYKTRVNAYVAMTMDFCRQKNNFGQLKKDIVEECIPRVQADMREKAYITTVSRRFGWELEKVEDLDRIAGIDMALVQGDSKFCEAEGQIFRS